MIILISPAKTLDTSVPARDNSSLPEFLTKSKRLASNLRKKKPAALADLMSISAKLAQLNYERYQSWHTPYNISDANNAIFAFRGEVYNGLDIDSFTEEELEYTNNHLRILSGLYGVLKPMDAILPYRLEMGTKLNIGKYKNLYEFWGDNITKFIRSEMKNSEESTIINLASNEYFKAIDTKKLKFDVITPVFLDEKNGDFKVISFFAKKARGLMSSFILKNRIEKPEEIKHFSSEGYKYCLEMSNDNKFVFCR